MVGGAVGDAGAVAAQASSRIGRMRGREIAVRRYRPPAYWEEEESEGKAGQAVRPEPAKVRKNASVGGAEWGCGWLVRRS